MVVVLWFEITNNISTCVLCHILHRIDIYFIFTLSNLILFHNFDLTSYYEMKHDRTFHSNDNKK